MKLFTVLKDSYREAVDGKIFQAMVIIAGLFILFVASISYKPLTLKDTLENQYRLLNRFLSNNPGVGSPTFTVENYQITNGATEPWQADYELDIVLTCPNKDALALTRKSGIPGSKLETLKPMFDQTYYYLNNVNIRELPSETAGQVRFKVTTQGTSVTEATAWPHEPTVLFGVNAPIFTGTLRSLVYMVEQSLVNFLGGLALLLIGVIITAGFVPNLLRKGTLDLYIVKPIGRSELLVYKYIGGLLFALILTSFTVIGVWLAIGLRAGVWAPEFLMLIPIITMYFAILYAVSVLAAVLTRSALVAILVALLAWGGFSLAGYLNGKINTARAEEGKLRQMMGPDAPPADGGSALGLPRNAETAIHFAARALPRGWDLDTQSARAIAHGVLTEQEIKKRNLDEELPSWAETVGVSLGWIALLLGLACWRFEARDG